jgi:hypothetical protein
MRMTRPIKIDGDVAFVTLTKGYTATIDAVDVPLVDGCNWQALVDKRADGTIRTVYAYRSDCSGPKQRTVYLHRVLMENPDALQVDHRDGDGLNCRRNNLRLATNSQNACNGRTPATNTSGYKGVTWNKNKRKWTACIKLDGKARNLGLFHDPADAASAYAEASAQLHGDFGRTA